MQWDTATRYKLLLRINNNIVSASTRRDAFSAIAQSLGDIFHFDRLSINLFDEKTNSLSYLPQQRVFLLQRSAKMLGL